MNRESLNETRQTAYVTNASANSVVFYAMVYLNNKGLSPEEIENLRLKYSFENLDKHYFNIDELKHSFVNQSAFFLNLYKEMNENDRFEHFAENLEQQNRFKEVFKNYNDFISLKRQYNRRVFHDNLDCEFMRSDFNEETFHKNTGVFSEEEILKNEAYYVVDIEYLTELKMRLCKICAKKGQNKFNIKKEIPVEFVPTSDVNSQIIILQSELKIYENSNYIIITDFDKLKSKLENLLIERPNSSEHKILLDILKEENRTKSKIDVVELVNEYYLFSILEFIVADLLEYGECKVIKKINNEYIKKINMIKYGYQIGPLAGAGGRNFRIDEEVFFSVEDWIS